MPFMDKNQLVAAGFYYTNRGDVVRCAFCGVEVGMWDEDDCPLNEHRRFSPSCAFIKGLGNISVDKPVILLPSEEATLCNDVCGSRPNSLSRGSRRVLYTYYQKTFYRTFIYACPYTAIHYKTI